MPTLLQASVGAIELRDVITTRAEVLDAKAEALGAEAKALAARAAGTGTKTGIDSTVVSVHVRMRTSIGMDDPAIEVERCKT